MFKRLVKPRYFDRPRKTVCNSSKKEKFTIDTVERNISGEGKKPAFSALEFRRYEILQLFSYIRRCSFPFILSTLFPFFFFLNAFFRRQLCVVVLAIFFSFLFSLCLVSRAFFATRRFYRLN